jgi:chemotaxis response regulator CheB
MQVFEVEDGMRVLPNCAYIIPPNRDMAFLNGTLQLMEPSAPRGQRLPIDFFFRSLAGPARGARIATTGFVARSLLTSRTSEERPNTEPIPP